MVWRSECCSERPEISRLPHPAHHVDDGKIRIDFPDPARELPAVQTATDVDVGDQRLVTRPTVVEARKGVFAGLRDVRFEPAVRQRVFDEVLDVRFVLGNENADGVVHHCFS